MKTITAEQFNNHQPKAYVVLSRRDLKRMLKAIPSDNDSNCGIFVSEIRAQTGDGKLQIDSGDLSCWCRPAGTSEFVCTFDSNLRKEMDATSFPV